VVAVLPSNIKLNVFYIFAYTFFGTKIVGIHVYQKFRSKMNNQTQQKINKNATFWFVLSLHIGLGAGLYYYVNAPAKPGVPSAAQHAAAVKPIVP
jgi:hypothetical protein